VAKKKSKKDVCQRKNPNGDLVCGHLRSEHKPPSLHVRIKAQASSGGYAEVYKNLAPTHCEQFCTCIAFIEKDGSGEEKILDISERITERNPFKNARG